MKKLLVLDANSLFNRAFYGVRPLTASDGTPTNAVFGFLNILKKHLDREKPDYAAAAFDVHAPTFRHAMDPAYKATRRPMPEDLKKQLPFLKEACRALGIAEAEKEGYEADDFLGTLSALGEEQGLETVLVTGDRDSFQLVREHVTLYYASVGKDEVITPAALRERYGLSPQQMVDLKAIMGDSSDNIPGVRGIGEKTALKLMQEYGSLDAVYEHLETLPLGPAAKEKMAAGKEDAYRSRRLAEIERHIPGVTDLSAYRYEGVRKEEMRDLLCRLEFFKLLHAFELSEKEPERPEQTDLPLVQGSLFDAEPEKETANVPEIDAARVTNLTPDLMFNESGFFVRLEGETFRLAGEVAAYLEKASPRVPDSKAYYHALFDRFGFQTLPEASFDYRLAAYVINSQETSATLSRLSVIYLHENLPLGAEEDPRRVLLVMEKLYPVLQTQLVQTGVKDLFENAELPLSRVLAKMEREGFAVSREGIENYGAFLKEEIAKTEKAVFELAGEEFLIHSPKQLGAVLFEKLGLPAGKKTKTGYATDAETLSRLRGAFPIVDLVLYYRTVSKLYSTYVMGLLGQIGADGKIHTVFHQTQTATGRLSSAEPNLQNIPVKTALGREMRKFFIAGEEDAYLLDADYSQIELRVLAHISGDRNFIRYFLEGGDVHTQTASEIYGVSPEQVTPEMRKSAKAVNFGIVYGIGEYSLSQDLHISMREAKEMIERYFRLYPGVKAYLDGVKTAAREQGYVTTLFGRRRMIPELRSPKKPVQSFGERVAMNAPIQGTAADLIKLAMVRVDRRLEKEKLRARLVLQVHDELILLSPASECERAGAILTEEMENVARLAVPLIAETHKGRTWFECK